MKGNEMPVDRGWAWVVCAACMIETFIITGLFKSYGLFFVEFSDMFSANASTVSIMLSIQSIAGSVAAYLVLTVGELCFSNRTYIMFGAVLSSTAFLMTAFAPSMSFVLFSQGAIFGSSIAFINGPAIVMIGKYFEKRRGFANSMLKVGGGLGSLSLAPFYRYLLDELGLRGTMIIVAGLLLHILPCGALARPPEFYKKFTRKENDKTDETKEKLLTKEKLKDAYNLNSTDIYKKTNQGNTKQIIMKNKMRTSSQNSITRFENGNLQNGTLYIPGQTIEVKPDHHLSYDRLFPKKDIVRLMRTFSENHENVHTSSQNSENHPSIGTAVVNALSTSTVALYGSIGETYGSVCNIQTEDRDILENYDNNVVSSNKCCFRLRNVTRKQVLSRILAFRLLKNKLFLLLVPSGMLSIIGFALIITFIPPHAKDVGIDDTKTALLISIVSGTDLAGKFITAFISDLKHIKRHLILAVPMLITGCICQLMPLMTEFWSLAVFSVVYGFSGGFYFAIFAVVIIDFVGVNNLSSALGIMVLSNGIAKAAATPILGFLRDSTGSYVTGFHFLGTCLLIGGFILMLEPVARRWEKKSSSNTDPEKN